jgi:SagB-type dehydrogenase family enzyme
VTRLLRNPALLVCWSGGRLLIRDLENGRSVRAEADAVTLLDLFATPRTPSEAARRLPEFEKRSVALAVKKLARAGLLLPESEARRRVARLRAWRENLASAFYHSAVRDQPYLRSEAATARYLRRMVASRPPTRSKRYPKAPRVRMPRALPRGDCEASLRTILQSRRTVRRFARKSLDLEDLAALVRGTWGKTGEIDAGILGRLATKTSPSAGALHPIECYLLAWNVRGLAPGLYHYDVAGDELRRLKPGSMRAAAVEAASGQRWIGKAAFLCVMTAAFGRTLWKYGMESAYRVLWLEAGHLAQTFCLLATARGLGSFVGDTLQDSFLERLIGLDGVREFPVYLCGAGVPADVPSSVRSGVGAGLVPARGRPQGPPLRQKTVRGPLP